MNRGSRSRFRTGSGRGNYVYVPKPRSSSSFGGPSAPPHRSAGNYGSLNESPSGRESELSKNAGKDPGLKSFSSVSKQSDPMSDTDAEPEPFTPSPDFVEASSRMENLRIANVSPAAAGCNSDQLQSSSLSSNFDVNFPSLSAQSSVKDKYSGAEWQQKEHTQDASGKSDKNSESSCMVDSSMRYGQASHEKTDSSGKLENSQILHPGIVSAKLASHEKSDGSGNLEASPVLHPVVPYDICVVRTGIQLKTPLLIRNKEKRIEAKRLKEAQSIKELRPGMVHLSRYLSLADQVKITENCRRLGLGPGGFYQPGYRDGAKLNLKMMCLGKNWDPQTGEYGDQRLTDGAKPPAIPNEFYELVQRAIQDSHAYLKKQYNRTHVEDILPSMAPDLCIVNFYTSTGRLGLHQDKDETRESLHSRLPVVSLSIGDSAEFVYSDKRDINNAEKVVLESGDVLIFGGESRHVFHGVTTINPETAPKSLLDEANLRPGRLNLTFRKY